MLVKTQAMEQFNFGFRRKDTTSIFGEAAQPAPFQDRAK